MPASVSERRRWLTLAAMSGALAMVFLDQTVVGVALPTIRRELGIGLTLSQWIPNAYLVVVAAFGRCGASPTGVAQRLSSSRARAATWSGVNPNFS